MTTPTHSYSPVSPTLTGGLTTGALAAVALIALKQWSGYSVALIQNLEGISAGLAAGVVGGVAITAAVADKGTQYFLSKVFKVKNFTLLQFFGTASGLLMSSGVASLLISKNIIPLLSVSSMPLVAWGALAFLIYKFVAIRQNLAIIAAIAVIPRNTATTSQMGQVQILLQRNAELQLALDTLKQAQSTSNPDTATTSQQGQIQNQQRNAELQQELDTLRTTQITSLTNSETQNEGLSDPKPENEQLESLKKELEQIKAAYEESIAKTSQLEIDLAFWKNLLIPQPPPLTLPEVVPANSTSSDKQISRKKRKTDEATSQNVPADFMNELFSALKGGITLKKVSSKNKGEPNKENTANFQEQVANSWSRNIKVQDLSPQRKIYARRRAHYGTPSPQKKQETDHSPKINPLPPSSPFNFYEETSSS